MLLRFSSAPAAKKKDDSAKSVAKKPSSEKEAAKREAELERKERESMKNKNADEYDTGDGFVVDSDEEDGTVFPFNSHSNLARECKLTVFVGCSG